VYKIKTLSFKMYGLKYMY